MGRKIGDFPNLEIEDFVGQNTHTHEVPGTKKKVSKRINITFRQIGSKKDQYYNLDKILTILII